MNKSHSGSIAAPAWFCRNDFNGFWALFADNLANMVIASGICSGLFGMPDAIVYGRILPGLGMSLLFGLGFYAYKARQLGIKEGRDDVTALPYGISTPVLFVYLFGVIGPVNQATGDPELAWKVALAAACVGGFVECLGSILGPWIKRVTPRAGMLGTLAGIALVWIATVPLAEIFEHPEIGFPCLALILAGLVAGIKMPGGVPTGLLAIGVGTLIGLLTGVSHLSTVGLGVHLPLLSVSPMLDGFRYLLGHPVVLAGVIPIEIYNFIETMNNVESAEAAGDRYDVRPCQLADGLGTIVGSVFGACFPTTVYIGHPAYKRLGSRIGYALGVGIAFFLIALFGLMGPLNDLIPKAAVAPMLVFVGCVITAQAFTAVPKTQAIASAVAMIPHISSLLHVKISSLLAHLRIPFDEGLKADLLRFQGMHLRGHEALSQGAIIIGLLWGGLVATLLDGRLKVAGHFATVAGVLSALGVIHRWSLGISFDRLVLGYVLMAMLFYALHGLGSSRDAGLEHEW